MSFNGPLFNFNQAKYRFVLISVTNSCNNSCAYCYLGCNKNLAKKEIKLGDVEIIITKYAEYLKKYPPEERFLTIMWHGGEPLLRGIPFFEKLMEIEDKISKKFSISINNGIETNGRLLNQNWCDFFMANDFFVGLSLDGPEFVQDIHRKTREGKSSFDETYKAIELLEKNKIDYSVISVITNQNYLYYKQMVDFFSKLKGLRYADFLPSYDPEGLIEYLSPENYAIFLTNTFDYWAESGNIAKLRIRFFDDIILKISGKVAGNTPIGCEIMGRCGEIQYVDEEGNLYPCCALPLNFKMQMTSLISGTLEKGILSKNYQNFQKDFNNLHKDCINCNFIKFCRGGCAARRFYHPGKEGDGRDYYCSARRKIIARIINFLEAIKMEKETGINTFVRGPKPKESQKEGIAEVLNTFAKERKILRAE